MTRVLLQAGHGLDCYSSALTEGGWRPGEERVVSASVAAYLTDTFPGAFVVVPDPEPAPRARARKDPTPDAGG